MVFVGNIDRMKCGHLIQTHTEPVPLTNMAVPQPITVLPLVFGALLSHLIPIQGCFSLLKGEPKMSSL